MDADTQREHLANQARLIYRQEMTVASTVAAALITNTGRPWSPKEAVELINHIHQGMFIAAKRPLKPLKTEAVR